MVIVHDTDKYKYYDKQKKVDLIKYSNYIKTVYDGFAIYLPRPLYDGDGLFNYFSKFVSDNMYTIKDIVGVVSLVADYVGKIGNNFRYNKVN